ncbi:hypothetical protein [Rugosimonospora africana]|uniref:Uncharacterized protein n=1 Tax=Rugosimonospora africana TaxID=556532 RepID=A0A8J3VQ45_9ACTN|nr:hypothetical protein [Rugosimonospora africana]GIH14081.1 hypothetical protein Raf01_22530 [Rugosimonospora africana]
MGKPTDNWHPVDQAPIKVDISGLQDFAKLLDDELKNDFQVNLKQGVEPMLHVAAPFGGGGLKEGQFFNQMHRNSELSIGRMLGDVAMGLQALSAAATSIYFEYLGGDNLGSAEVDDVMNAFYPPPGTMTLRQKAAQDDKANDGDQSDGKTPSEDPNIPKIDPNAKVPSFNADDPQVIAKGQAGEYTIPGDSDHMADTPADPIKP